MGMFYPPNPKVYNAQVYAVVQQIPAGRVCSYGRIAALIVPPDDVEPPQYARLSPRWVGSALRHTPNNLDIPWHRVINSRGMISLPAGSPGANEQRTLLEAEGVVFNAADRVDFKVFGWP